MPQQDWFSSNAPSRSTGSDDWFSSNSPKQVKPQLEAPAMSSPGKGFSDAANPVAMAEGLYNSVRHPWDTIRGLAQSHIDTGKKAVDSFQRGDYHSAFSQAINTAVPVMGPAFENAITKAEAEGGNTGYLLGYGAGNIAMSVLPYAMKGKGVKVIPSFKNPNAYEASALEMLKSEGVPIPAGTMTGNPWVKALQKGVETTPIGSMVTTNRAANQTRTLRNLGQNLADETSPTPVVPQQAGEAVRGKLQSETNVRAANADQSYNDFRAIEANKPMMVDLSQIKATLQPIYDDMSKWWEPAKRNSSEGYQAIKSILQGADTIPASQAEAGLSGLKQLARESDGRNSGLAKLAIPKVQAQIDSTVASVDASAAQLLKNARQFTSEQYTVKGVLDQLRKEPVEAFNQLVYSKDAGIARLKEVAVHAPGEMKKVGRAYVEDLLSTAEAEGGFGKAGTMWNKWERLGDESKKILYSDPVLRERLDKFFLGAKRLADNPNPSGTATTTLAIGSTGLLLTEPFTGITFMLGSGALAKLLNSNMGAKLLSDGVRIPISKKASSQATVLQLLKLAGKDAQPVLEPAFQ